MKLSSQHHHWWSVALIAAALALTFEFTVTTIASAIPANTDCIDSPGTSGTCSSPQPLSNADQNNTGANDTSNSNAYASTRHGAASDNGIGSGQATGEPCAACVGKADNKNPPGQAPDATDANNGYECDGNNGIARTNPAHTGCAGPPPTVPTTPTTVPTTPTTVPTTPSTVPTTETSEVPPGVSPTSFTPPASVLGETLTAVAPSRAVAPNQAEALARTGSPAGLLTLLAGALLVAGGVVVAASRRLRMA